MTEFEDPRVEELDSDDEVVESKVAVPDEDEVQYIYIFKCIKKHMFIFCDFISILGERYNKR